MPYLIAWEPIQLSFGEHLRIALLTTFWIGWFFFLGAALGSFLNVVVYRLPLGMNPVRPKSRCPKCGSGIRPWDNIPVVSWLLLGGRCRACQAAISSRYVIVEGLLGSLFVGLLAATVLSGGANVPLRQLRSSLQLPMLEHFLELDLVRLFFFHGALIWWLVGMGLFRLDGNRIPTRFLLYGALVGLLVPLVWPDLRPLDRLLPVPQSVLGGVLGLLAGGFVGIVLARGSHRRKVTEVVRHETLYPCLVAGAFLGPFAIVAAGLVAAVLRFTVVLVSLLLPKLRRIPLTCSTALGILATLALLPLAVSSRSTTVVLMLAATALVSQMGRLIALKFE